MKKARIKQRLSALLAASILLSATAPASTAYAASPEIVLDFATNNKGIFQQSDNKILKDPNGSAGSEIRTEDAQFLHHLTGSVYSLPWVPLAGYGSSSTLPIADSETPAGFAGVTGYAARIKEDYELEGWIETIGAQDRRSTISKYYDRNKTYQLKLKAKNNQYTINYRYTIDGETDRNKIVYFGESGQTGATNPRRDIKNDAQHLTVLTPSVKGGINIAGFKVSDTLTNTKFYTVSPKDPSHRATIDADGKIAGTETAEGRYTIPMTGGSGQNFSYNDTIQRVEGYVVPYDVNVDLVYEPDPDFKASLTVKERFVKSDGTTEITQKNKDVHQLNASRDLPTGIGVNTAYTSGSTPKYILRDVKLYKAGTTTELPNRGSSSSPTDPEVGKMMASNLVINADHSLTGKMLNYDVDVVYTYKVNPAYEKQIKVKYEDEKGNDITDLVKEKIAASGITVHSGAGPLPPTTPAGTEHVGEGLVYDGATLNYKMDRDSTYRILAPAIPDYMGVGGLTSPTAPTMSSTVGNPVINGFSITKPTWTSTDPYFTVSRSALPPTDDFTLVVKYTLNPNIVKDIKYRIIGGGKVMVGSTEYSVATTGHLQKVIKELRAANNGTYNLTAEKLHSYLPDPGYRFAGYEYRDSSSTAANPHFTPFTVGDYIPETALDTTGNSILVRLNFEPDPALMNNYAFTSNDPNLNYTGLNTTRIENIANIQADGSPRVITLADLDGQANHSTVTANAGYRVGWFLQSGGGEITASTDIAGMSGATFVARAVSTAALTPYAPVVTGELSAAGVPTIQVDPTAPQIIDTRLNYVVTDGAGNVVANISGNELAGAGGVISGNFLTPGYPYNVTTVDPSAPAAAGIAVGSPLPALAQGTEASAPTPAVLPATATAPAVGYDPADPARFAITVNPTSPDTEYALLDDQGNVVHPFMTPTTAGGALVFNNLDPDTTYTVVPRRAGSTDAGYPANGTQVSTGTLTPPTIPHAVVFTSPVDPAFVKLDGVTKTAADLASVAPGTRVEITAAAIDTVNPPFNAFSSLSYPSGLVNTSTNPAILSFVMPNYEVNVIARYLRAGIVIDAATPSSATPAPTIPSGVIFDGLAAGDRSGATFPSVDASVPDGRYRIHVVKAAADAAQRQAGAEGETNPYTDKFVVRAVIEMWDTVSNTWVEQSGAGFGPIALLLDTGSANRTDSYSFKQLDGVGGAHPIDVTAADFNSENSIYPGFFTVNVENAEQYIFGYTTPPVYTVNLKSNRITTLNKRIRILQGNALNAEIGIYTAEINAERGLPVIDADGITWSYKGLSTSATDYMPFDETRVLTSDEVVYIFFSNDRDARQTADTELTNLLTNASALATDPTLSAPFKTRLNAQIAAALATLNQVSPRKASTDELNEAIRLLRAAMNRGNTINSGGSGGSGGGGGSRSIAAATKPKTPNVINASTDGNWELVSPESHRWVFNLNSGERLSGWHQLAYTYNGEQRVNWYHFEGNNIMDDGWYLDRNTDTWYYLSENHDGFFGHMVTGWYMDQTDGKWYYFDPVSGAMATGWRLIDGKWYYFNTTAADNTWFYNETTHKWEYRFNTDVRPLGSLFIAEQTPDNYTVNGDGVWVK